MLFHATMRLSFGVVASVFAVALVACGSAEDGSLSPAGDSTPTNAPVAAGDDGVGDDSDGPVVAGDDSSKTPGGTEPLTTTATATGDVNLRKGPATTFEVLVVIPTGATVTVLSPTKENEFYHVKFNGTEGWAHSKYLTSSASPTTPTAPGDLSGPPSVANAMARAATSKGFSYWWGGGAFPGVAATASNKGACNGGGCPNCTHSGQFGADCSGLVAKAWQYGNTKLEVNSHPYGTIHFVNDVAGKWSTVSRGTMKAADALVYNSGGAGHIVVYEKGDGWGSPTVYECKGCQYGCVYNARNFASSYHAIRRAGF